MFNNGGRIKLNWNIAKDRSWGGNATEAKICLPQDVPCDVTKAKTGGNMLSIRWALLATHSVDFNGRVNSTERGLWCNVVSASHCVPLRMTHRNNLSLSQCQETLCFSRTAALLYLDFYISVSWPRFPFSFDCREAPSQISGPSELYGRDSVYKHCPWLSFLSFLPNGLLFINTLRLLYAVFKKKNWNGMERRKNRNEKVKRKKLRGKWFNIPFRFSWRASILLVSHGYKSVDTFNW